MTITTVAIACDVGLPDNSEFTASRLDFTLSGPDYDTVSNDSIPAITVSVTLDSSGVGTANLWPVDRGTRNTHYIVTLYGSITANGSAVAKSYELGIITPPGDATPNLANLLAQSSGGIVVGSTIYASIADAVAAAVEASGDAAGYAAAAELAALAAGAPIVTALTSPTPANGVVELLKVDAGLIVYQVVAGSWSMVGWLQGPEFKTVADMLASTATTLGATGGIVKAGGFRYQIVTTGEHLTTAGGVKLYVQLENGLYDVKAFGATGLGVVNDVLPARAAFAAGPNVIFPSGTYYFGEYTSTSNEVFDLVDGQFDVRSGGDVEFVIRTATGIGDCFPALFHLRNASNSRFGVFRFRDLGYDGSTSNSRGLVAYRLTGNAGTGSWGGVSIDGITCVDCTAPISIEGDLGASRVNGVHVSQIDLDNCYYGVVAQNQGDYVTVGVMRCNEVRRVYFVYGCKSHNARILDRNPKGSTGSVNISRSVGGFDTEDINVWYSCREATVVNQLYALVNHIDLLGGAIRGINLRLDIDVPVVAVPVRFINYDGAGVQTSAASTNIVDDIVISGRWGTTSQSINTVASYGFRGDLDVQVNGAVIQALTREAFILENDDGTWTPTLVDGDLNVAEGQTASVAVGSFSKRGNIVHFSGRITMTSLGSLNTSSVAAVFGLPYVSANISNRIGDVTVGFAANLNLASVCTVTGYVGQNVRHITLQKWNVTTGVSGVAVSEISADGQLSFSGSYTIA